MSRDQRRGHSYIANVSGECLAGLRERQLKQSTAAKHPHIHRQHSRSQNVSHEHHDFFLASQHPLATNTLRQFTSKYTMPARMWHYGIHSFLELPRHYLPASLERMLSFIYEAYTTIALLYKTIPTVQDTWIKVIGDSGRHRIAIEDNDTQDGEIWTRASRYWYTIASNTTPTIGRLYHHLAILARPNSLQQLHFYAESLCVEIPFPKARDSLMTLLNEGQNTSQRLEPLDAAFVRVHGILFSGRSQFEYSNKQFLDLLDMRVAREHENWLEAG